MERRFGIKRLLAATLIMLAVCFSARFAHAVGTLAGTGITNQATATYTVGASNFSENSNVTTTTVAELLNVTVTWQDASNVNVGPGDTNQVLTFQVSNTGNGTDDYTLAGLSILGGDDFDPTLVGIYFDTNGNGSYDAGTDVQYVQGTNDPSIPADGSITVFVINDIPGGVSDGNLGNSQLTATSNTGSGAPGTIVAGAGEGGTDAVVGTTGGSGSGIGIYEVSSVTVSLIKSVSIADPFGGTEPFPGAVLTYSVVVTVAGSGTALGVVLTDPIPADTTYNAGTLTLNGGPLTDAGGDDAGDVGATTPGTVTVNLGDLTAASPAQTIAFDVTIN